LFQVVGPALNGLFAGIALDDDRLVEEQFAALCVISPYAFAPKVDPIG
jgi:hypothetical protein